MVDLVPFIYFCVLLSQHNLTITVLITVFTRQDMGATFCSCALTLTLSCRLTDDPICSGSNIGELNANRLLQHEVPYFGILVFLNPNATPLVRCSFHLKLLAAELIPRILVVSPELSFFKVKLIDDVHPSNSDVSRV